MSDIEGEVKAGCDVTVGCYHLHFELPFSNVYNKDGNPIYFEVFATRVEGGCRFFLSLQKEESFKELVRGDIQEVNWHLSIVPLAMPTLKLSRKTIQNILEVMANLN